MSFFLQFSFSLVELSVSLDTDATHRGVVLIVITFKNNCYVGRNCLESVVVVCVTIAFLDGYPGRTASLHRSGASLMRLKGVSQS